jgi:hypothetical protein
MSGEAVVGGDEDVGAQPAARELVEQSAQLGVDTPQRVLRSRRADPALVGGGVRIGEPEDDDVRAEVVETDLEQSVYIALAGDSAPERLEIELQAADDRRSVDGTLR